MPRVILLHGLWMRGLSMGLLQHRLEKAGYLVETFDYWSVKSPLEKNIHDLRKRICSYPQTVHLVGHSLGGVLALLACHQQPDLLPGRIVCLSSPLTGSAVARQLAEHGGGKLMGHSRQILEQGIATWEGPRDVGMIAGRTGIGVGAVVGQLATPNDGTVAVEETRLAGLSDHILVSASHTGILLSKEAASLVDRFLQSGKFAPD